MKNIYIDQLNLYRGIPVKICNGIEIHVPTLSEICDYGEAKYYQMIHTLCSVGIDWCWQLEEMGIPFDEISDYSLFWQLLCRQYTSNDTKILFGDTLDFSKMDVCIDKKDDSVLLVQKSTNTDHIIIHEDIYFIMAAYLREIHNLKRDNRVAGTRSCRKAFIEDAKMEYEAKKDTHIKSTLLPMISTMVNMEGFKRDDATVWNMNIYAFMDSIKRISKIRNSNLLLQSGYSGFGIDLKKIKKEELNYLGELD